MTSPTKAQLLYAVEKRLQDQWGFRGQMWTNGTHLIVNTCKASVRLTDFNFRDFEYQRHELTPYYGNDPLDELAAVISTEVALGLNLRKVDKPLRATVEVIEKGPVSKKLGEFTKDGVFEGEFGDGGVD